MATHRPRQFFLNDNGKKALFFKSLTVAYLADVVTGEAEEEEMNYCSVRGVKIFRRRTQDRNNR